MQNAKFDQLKKDLGNSDSKMIRLKDAFENFDRCKIYVMFVVLGCLLTGVFSFIIHIENFTFWIFAPTAGAIMAWCVFARLYSVRLAEYQKEYQTNRSLKNALALIEEQTPQDQPSQS